MSLNPPDAKTLQEQLHTLGEYNGDIDGVFSPELQQAIKLFQRHYNHDHSEKLHVNGEVDSRTLAAIDDAVEEHGKTHDHTKIQSLLNKDSAGGHWQAYVQSTGQNELGAEQCKLVLMSPDGKTELTYEGVSGGRTGHDPLPGLVGDKDLVKASHDPKEPVTKYNFGKLQMVDPNDPQGKYFANDNGHAYFVPITNNDVVSWHGDYGVHPHDENRLADRSEGCIGLHNDDSERFLHDYARLQEKGVAPKKLEVYSKDQDPEQLIAERQNTKMSVAEFTDMLEHYPAPSYTPQHTPASAKEKSGAAPSK